MYHSSSEPDDPNDSDFIPETDHGEESDEEANDVILPTPDKGKRKMVNPKRSKDKVPLSKKKKDDISLTDDKRKKLKEYNQKIDELQELVKDLENPNYIKVFTKIMELTTLDLDWDVIVHSYKSPLLIEILIKLQSVETGFAGFRTQVRRFLTLLAKELHPSVAKESTESGENSQGPSHGSSSKPRKDSESSHIESITGPSSRKKPRKERLREFFKIDDAVLPRGEKMGLYKFKCVYEDCPNKKGVNCLKTHLMTVKHGNHELWPELRAKQEHSIRVRMYRWVAKESYIGVFRPMVCTHHGVCVDRISLHIKDHHPNGLDKKFIKEPKITFIPADKGPTLGEYNSADDLSDRDDDYVKQHEDYESIFKKPLLHARRITGGERKSFGKKKGEKLSTEFKFTYDHQHHLLIDFERYMITQGKSEKNAKQVKNRLDYVWECMDPTKCLINNVLKKREELEDSYFLKLFIEIKRNSKKPFTKGISYQQANTVGARLLAAGAFLNFLVLRDVYVDLTFNEIDRARMKVKELLERLQPYAIERQKVVFRWKQKHLLKMDDFIKIGSSNFALNVACVLEEPEKLAFFKLKLTDLRNMLIFLIVMGNAARSSNIVEMTLQHINEAVESSEYTSNDSAMVVVSDVYKTSIIYGEKLMVIPKDIFKQLKTYIKVVRPMLINDEELDDSKRYLFTSSRATKTTKSKKDKCTTMGPKPKDDGKMTTSNVAGACSRVYEMAEMEGEGELKRCAPTRIRHAVATELAGHDGEKCEIVATLFMKNKESTTRKFYVLNFEQRESVRLSMKMYEKMRGKSFDPSKVPRPTEVSKNEELAFMERLKKNIREEFGNEINDPKLIKSIISEPDDEEALFNTQQEEENTVDKEPQQSQTAPGENVDFGVVSSRKEPQPCPPSEKEESSKTVKDVDLCNGEPSEPSCQPSEKKDNSKTVDNPVISDGVEILYHENNIMLYDTIPGVWNEDEELVPDPPKVPILEMARINSIVEGIEKDTVIEWFTSNATWVESLLSKKCASMRLDIITGRGKYFNRVSTETNEQEDEEDKQEREEVEKDAEDKQSDEAEDKRNDQAKEHEFIEVVVTPKMVMRHMGLGFIGTGNFRDDAFDAVNDKITELTKDIRKTNIVIGVYCPIILIWMVQSLCRINYQAAMFYLDNSYLLQMKGSRKNDEESDEDEELNESSKIGKTIKIRKTIQQKIDRLTNEIDSKSNKNDLCKTVKYRRSEYLMTLYINRNEIENDSWDTKTWTTKKKAYDHVFPINIENQKVKDIIRGMVRQYNKDKVNDCRNWEKQLGKAREYYRKLESLHNNLVTEY